MISVTFHDIQLWVGCFQQRVLRGMGAAVEFVYCRLKPRTRSDYAKIVEEFNQSAKSTDNRSLIFEF